MASLPERERHRENNRINLCLEGADLVLAGSHIPELEAVKVEIEQIAQKVFASEE